MTADFNDCVRSELALIIFLLIMGCVSLLCMVDNFREDHRRCKTIFFPGMQLCYLELLLNLACKTC